MSLTGGAFLSTLIALCVLAVAATVLLAPRIPGPRPVAVLGRVVLVAFCQLVAVATVAVWINNSFGLYTSWSDLLGTGAQTATGPMAGPPERTATFSPGPAGGVLQTYVRGDASKLAGQVLVWTPPEYGQARYRHTRFPVLTLLHGVPGSPETWTDVGGMPQAVQQLLSAGRIRPFILVMPTIDPGGVNTDCSDVGSTRTATWLTHDVPTLVDRHFRTLTTARSRALLGYSTGGFCAVKLPLQYPGVYATGAAMSPDPLDGDPDVLPDPPVRARNSPQELIRRSHPPVALYLATTDQDRNSRPADLRRFQRAARGPTRVSTLVLPTGGHNFGTWQQMYATLLPWISARLTGAATPR
ncbi:alpha/beta hydrolase [Streptomyces sp. NPDC092296]|uniref:alpha/beta hydrolase n=1 Tax=Streptomyces sp. NPDC092296 TaxID=3366012 RepID=UPI0037FBCF20